MGKLILIEGEPGSGKSTSIRNLDPKTTFFITPNAKDLPFKGSRKIYSTEAGNKVVTNSILEIGAYLKKINEGTKFKTVIIEDFTHSLTKRVMKDTALSGFGKWNDLAVDAYNSIFYLENALRDDLYVIIIGHVEDTQDSDGESVTKLLTPGKLLDRGIKIPSFVTYILHTEVVEEDGEIKYQFLTNKDGSGREAKSPMGCLDLHEANDIKTIIDKIEAYQN